ncbi:MAG: hypothetical protein JNM51_00470 [Bacteroidia bacterium]|nr:hypothetical protein [Bacteroidia bacterium]
MGRKILAGLGIVIGILVLILFFAGLLNVLGNWLFSKIPFLADLRDKGALGDAINGLTAPVITLGSAIVVYLTFREQNKANKEFSDHAIEETYSRTFSEIKSEFENLTLRTRAKFSDGTKHIVERRGVDALRKFVDGFTKIYIPKEGHFLMKDLSYICQELTALTNEIHQSNLPFAKKQYLLLRINRFFVAKMDHYIQKLEVLIVADTDESKPFNNFYRSSMQGLRTVRQTVIDGYFPR